jgi:hypothetical protein
VPASRARAVVVWSSFVLAVVGWVVAVYEVHEHGYTAGVDPAFIGALTVAATFSMTFTVAFVMPDKVKLYGLGFAEGVAFAESHRGDPEPGAREREGHLRAVR